MNSNRVVRENSFLFSALAVIAVIAFIFFAFGRDSKTTVTTSSDSRESSFISHSDESFSTEGQTVISDASAETLVPVKSVAVSQKPYRWCAMFNDNGNMHVPDLFGQGLPNEYGGTDWHNTATANGTEDHGIISENGALIFFIKKAYLTQNGLTEISSVLMKSELNWKGVPMSWANVAGEPALIAVIK